MKIEDPVRKSDFIKAAIMAHWRYIKGCPLVATECSAMLRPTNRGDRADVLAMTSTGILIETEVKTTIDDLKGDLRKQIHQDFVTKRFKYPVHYFSFAVLKELEQYAKPVVQQMYPYAGLLVVSGHYRVDTPLVEVAIPAKRFPKPPLNNAQIKVMERSAAATICKQAFQLCRKA
jgi:hypothetical protein